MNVTENHIIKHDQVILKCPACEKYIGLKTTLQQEACLHCSTPIEIHAKTKTNQSTKPNS